MKNSTPIDLDAVDLRILDLLQRDARLTVNEIAERIHLSPTPVWRRIQRLEETGVITARVALLDPAAVNAGVTVFVSIRTSQHNAAWYEKFSRAVAAIPEIVDLYRMSGEIDYLLRVVVPDIAGYDAVYQRLIRSIDIHDVSSSFAMERLKSTTALPLHFVDAGAHGAARTRRRPAAAPKARRPR
jgi:Lrp/AsnC family transcriptional regulator